MGSCIIWPAVQATTQEVFNIISHVDGYSGLLSGLGPLEATFLHLDIYSCTLASEIFLNHKFDHVTPLLLTLQKLPIAP